MSLLDFVEFLSSPSEEEDDEEEEEEIVDCNHDDETSQQSEQKPSDETILNEIQYEKITVKKNSEKKAEALFRLQQLHTHIIAMEKEKKSSFYHKARKENQDYKELFHFENNCNMLRKKELESMNETLKKISSNIDRFKHEKQLMKRQASYLEKLKVLMEDIESSIMQFKEDQKLKYEDLLSEEKSLSADIESYKVKFEQWSKTSTKVDTVITDFEKNNKVIDLPREVEDFERFLQLTGGHQGGWDDIDHNTFLKLHRNIKNKNELVNAAIRDIPTQNHEDILQHIEWYVEYCILKDKKREAIRIWKTEKNNEKIQRLNEVVFDETSNERKKKKEQLFMKEQQERFEKLQSWKAKKVEEEEREINMEENKLRKQKLQEAVFERQRLEQKIKVQKYKQRKQEEQIILDAAKKDKQKTDKMRLTSEEKERIMNRNEKIVQNKRNELLLKEQKKADAEERLAKLKSTSVVHVERDPSRLYQPTEGWKCRMKTESISTGNKAQGSRMMPHRAVPSWRQGLQ